MSAAVATVAAALAFGACSSGNPDVDLSQAGPAGTPSTATVTVTEEHDMIANRSIASARGELGGLGVDRARLRLLRCGGPVERIEQR